MMRRILTFLLALPFSLFPLHAQQVWTAGSVWEVNCEERYTHNGQINTVSHTIVYTLEDAIDIEGVLYFPLTKAGNFYDITETIAYIRSERGDSLVYVRKAIDIGYPPKPNSAGDEMLLYDFTKRFDYGDVITYGTEDGPKTTKVDRQYGTLDYYYDVIEEGDCLPAWGSLIYKIGALDGPMGLFLCQTEGGTNPNPEDPDLTDGDKPKSSNVSHTLFKRKGGGGCMIVPTPDGIRVIEFTDESPACYDLCGRPCREAPEGKGAHSSAPHSFYIYKGRKHIK